MIHATRRPKGGLARARHHRGSPAERDSGPDPAPFASVDAMLDAARRTLSRLTPHEAARAMVGGARLVDIRPEWQRRAEGEIPGAVVVERNQLEWRLHPASDARLPASLVRLGIDATDVVGGITGWRDAGLPTVAGPTPVEQVVLDGPAGPVG